MQHEKNTEQNTDSRSIAEDLHLWGLSSAGIHKRLQELADELQETLRFVQEARTQLQIS